jgi:hypothetical protein
LPQGKLADGTVVPRPCAERRARPAAGCHVVR